MKRVTPRKIRPDKTFTFKSFNDHISEININLIRKVDTAQGIPEDGDESVFHATIQKFSDFNCTADFATIKRRLGGFSTFYSLAQVLHRKDELFHVLLDSLGKQDGQASDVTLELIVALASDIGDNFYPYFEPTFNVVVDLLNTQDHRLLENIFMTLANLFRLLWKPMINDVKKIIRLFSNLFSYKRPDYIRSFAAQSLTYLARKIPNKEGLIGFILKEVDSDINIINGISHLLFEIVKGVPGNLHSCANSYLDLIFRKFAEDYSTSTNVRDCLNDFSSLIADHIDKEHSDVIWTSLLSVCESLIQSPQQFKPIVSILFFFVSHKRGDLIDDPEPLISFTIASLQAMFDIQNCLDILLKLTSALVNNLYLSIEPDRRRSLIKTAFDSNIIPAQVDSFVGSLFYNRFFESDILPLLLERCYQPLLRSPSLLPDATPEQNKEFFETIELLDKLISAKKPLPVLETLPTFETYPLDFSRITSLEGCNNMVASLLKVLINPNDWKLVKNVINVLPHINPLDKPLVISGLISLIYKIMAKLSENISEDEAILLHIILSESIYSLGLLRSEELFVEFKQDFFIHLFEKYPGNAIILQGFVFFFQYAHFVNRKDVFGREFFETLFFKFFQDNLSHPKSQVRFLTLIAINMFDPPMQPNESGKVAQSIFSIMLESEMISVTIQDYRDKLRLINHLDFSLVGSCLPLPSLDGQKYDLAPLYYLLGTLYYNFTPLWQPVQKLIQDYGLKNRLAFWKIMGQHFNQTQSYIRSCNLTDYKSYWPRLSQTNEANPRPDFLNHRILLLQIFKSIADVVEPHADEVIFWLFCFLEHEADSINITSFKGTEDISSIDANASFTSNDAQTEFEDSLDQQSDEDEEEENEENANKENENQDAKNMKMEEEIERRAKKMKIVKHVNKNPNANALWKTLTAFLELLASFKNPAKYDKEEKLLQLHHNLLQHVNLNIQKAALNCLLAYNDKNIMPYRENLLRLLDDTTFKTEILLFGSRGPDSEKDLIKEKHRKFVMPLVMRILYGKMLSKTGDKTSGKAYIDVRRSIVFRFLASCSKDEVMLFLKLAFSDLVPYMDMEMSEMFNAFEALDIHKCIPLKHILSSLKTLDLMLVHFGNVITDLLPNLFNLLLIISTFGKTLSERRPLLNSFAVDKLKVIRKEIFKLTEKFFNLFDTYHFSITEIDHLFASLITPKAVKMADENLLSPSSLLHLLKCWSDNPRYFILFGKQLTGAENVTLLSCLVNLYSSDKASSSVINFISSIFVNLLSYENHSPMDEEEKNDLDSDGPFLEVNGLIDESFIEKYKSKTGDLNFGTQLLIPYITPILGKIRKNLASRMKQKGKHRKPVIQDDEATILSHLSELVEKESDCVVLARLLIDSIDYRHDKVEESTIKALQSVNNLVKKITTNPRQFISKLCKLFELVTERNSRLELCKILSTTAQNIQTLVPLAEVVTMINAYNPRNPDEPDYTVREEGFSKARKIILEMTLDSVNEDFLRILIYNCCFFIRTSEDIGLRELSSNCLSTIVKHLSTLDKPKQFKNIVIKLLFLFQIKKGMKESSEQARHEFISVLTDLIKYCSDKDKLLGQLSLLSNEDTDLDFWANIRHIQVHRRIRALNRLSTNYALLSKLSPQILHDYLIPVATNFIADLKATKYGASSQYAVDLIGVICRYLSWPIYEKLLRLYLKRLVTDQENHKSNVRILCAILANFNYDLSKTTLLAECKESIRKPGSLTAATEEATPKQIPNIEMATKVHQTIIQDIVPKLHECLYKLSYSDYEYDAIRSEFNHEDEIQQMPLAVAMIKLLDCVPIEEALFDNHVRSIFIRLSNYLKSRMDSIREASRKTLCKIMEILGPKYLLSLIHEMKSVLTKGFQFHVLTFTLYIILKSMVPILKSGDLDEASTILIEIFHKELFSDIAEEKSVGKITSKCKEAKKTKSYASYQILGMSISNQNLIKCMLPLKQILDETHSPKVMKKVTICMEKFFFGLTDNKGLKEESLVLFIFDVLEDKIPQLKVTKVKSEVKKEKKRDSLLLKPEFKQKKLTKTNPVSNVFILFEYCLRLLLSLFKRNRFKPGSPCSEHLGKFVPILIDSLFCKHAKLTSTALRCLNQYIMRFPDLDDFKEKCETIKRDVLVLLDEFVSQGTNSKQNIELITICFKTISCLVRSIDSVKLDKSQLKVLLFYVEKDIHDRSKQSTAFSLLKAILTKRMDAPEIKDIMQKLTMIMMHSEDDHIREQCRLVWLKYLLNYPLGAQFTNHVQFFTRQLEYPREIGRSTILKLIFSLIKYQDKSQVSDNAASFYIPLATRLINDDSIKCRELAATILKKLISSISKKAKDSLFYDITLPWFQGDNLLHRQLAAQLFGIFAQAEEKDFRKRLSDCLPLLAQQTDPARFPLDNAHENQEKRRLNDHLLFQLLTFFHKIITSDSDVMQDPASIEHLNQIFMYIESDYLVYPHIWVRVLSVKIIESLFAYFPVEQISKTLISQTKGSFYLFNNTPLRLWNICKKHCFLFSIIYESAEIGDLLITNLHYIGRVFLTLPESFADDLKLNSQVNGTIKTEIINEDVQLKGKIKSAKKKRKIEVKSEIKVEPEDSELQGMIKNGKEEPNNFYNKLNITWLTNRLIREIKREVVSNPHDHQARICIFKWIAAFVVEANINIIQSNLRNLLIPLAREITSRNLKTAGRLEEEHPKQILVNQCLQLYEMIRNKVGIDLFSKTYAEVVTLHNRRKSERKASQAVQFLTNPVMALRRKHRIHQAYKESKKKRKDIRKGRVRRINKRPALYNR